MSYASGPDPLVAVRDGDQTTCKEASSSNSRKLRLGDVTIFKNIDVNVVTIKVDFNETINCHDANIFHYKLVNVSCKSLKMAKLVTGSLLTGNTCYYALQCNQGDVTCTIELLMIQAITYISICEIVIL